MYRDYGTRHHPSRMGNSCMKACLLEELMVGLSSWLSGDLVEKVVINRNGQLVMQYADGVTTVYRISD